MLWLLYTVCCATQQRIFSKYGDNKLILIWTGLITVLLLTIVFPVQDWSSLLLLWFITDIWFCFLQFLCLKVLSGADPTGHRTRYVAYCRRRRCCWSTSFCSSFSTWLCLLLPVLCPELEASFWLVIRWPVFDPDDMTFSGWLGGAISRTNKFLVPLPPFRPPTNHDCVDVADVDTKVPLRIRSYQRLFFMLYLLPKFCLF